MFHHKSIEPITKYNFNQENLVTLFTLALDLGFQYFDNEDDETIISKAVDLIKLHYIDSVELYEPADEITDIIQKINELDLEKYINYNTVDNFMSDV